MGLIRISENNDWTVDYDRNRGMYRVSYFEDKHWFAAFGNKEVDNRINNIVSFLEWVKKVNNMNNCIPKYIVLPSVLDFRSNEEKTIDLLDSIIEYVKNLNGFR